MNPSVGSYLRPGAGVPVRAGGRGAGEGGVRLGSPALGIRHHQPAARHVRHAVHQPHLLAAAAALARRPGPHLPPAQRNQGKTWNGHSQTLLQRMCDVAVVSAVPGGAGVRVTGSQLLGGPAGLVAEFPRQGLVGGGVSAGVADHPGAAAAAGGAGGQRGGGPAVAGGGGPAARAVTPAHPAPAGRDSVHNSTVTSNYLSSRSPVRSSRSQPISCGRRVQYS